MIRSLICLFVLCVLSVRATLDISACYGEQGKAAPTACFFPDFCKPSSADKSDQLVHASEIAKDNALTCFALVAFKKFNDHKWLVIMQNVNGNDRKREISVRFGNHKLLCKSKDGNTVKLETATLQKEIYKTVVRHDSLLCKFTVEGDLTGVADVSLTLSETPKVYKENGPKVHALIAATKQCDGSHLDFIGQEPRKDAELMRPLLEFDKVQCEKEGGQLFLAQGGIPVEVTIECNSGTKNYVAKQGGAELTLLLPKIACIIGTCTLCGDVEHLKALPESTAPTFSKATSAKDTCAKLECPGNRFHIAGMNATVAEPFCKKFAEGDFRWTIQYGSAKAEISFLAAECVGSVNCNDANPLRIEEGGGMSDPWSGMIQCSSGHHQIASRQSPSDDWTLFERLDCNTTTGEWEKVALQFASKSPLEKTAQIKCLSEKEEPPPESASHSEIDAVGIIVMVSVGVICILIIVSFCYFVTRRRRRMEKELAEVDAKEPTPPRGGESGRQSGPDVSFSPGRPPLSSPNDPEAPKLSKRTILTGKQLEEQISVTANMPTSDTLSVLGQAPAPVAKPAPAQPANDSPNNKKNLKELLDQSLPSLSE